MGQILITAFDMKKLKSNLNTLRFQLIISIQKSLETKKKN